MQDDGISVDVSHVDGLYTVTVAGDIDVVTAPVLAEELAQIRDGGRVVLDLAGVAFMDSPGLVPVMAAWVRLDQSRGSLRIRDPSPAVHRLLLVAGLDLIMGDGY